MPFPQARKNCWPICKFGMRLITVVSSQSGICAFTAIAGKNDQLHLSAYEAGTPQLAWIGESNLIEYTLDQASRFQNKLERISDVVEKINVDEDGSTLHLKNGGSIRTQIVIAADGANSPIRSELGIEVSEESYSQSAVVANWFCTYPHLETAFQWFLPGGDILAMLPLPSKQVSMVWSTSPERVADLLKLDQAQWLDQFALTCEWHHT